MDFNKEEIFKNVKAVTAGERLYRIIDTDGYFIRVIPQYITNKMYAGEFTHIERLSDKKNMGTELICYVEYVDEDYNYNPDGIVRVSPADYDFVLDQEPQVDGE